MRLSHLLEFLTRKPLRAVLGLFALILMPVCSAQDPVLAAGDQYSLGVNKDGVLFAWGLNTSGQLGDGTVISRSRPVRITGINPVNTVAAGGAHVLALLNDKTVWSWGQNGSGQLGDGSTTARSKPGVVPGLKNIIAVAAGQGFSLALRDDNTLWAWGRNNFGQLGDGSKLARSTPVQVVLPNPPADFRGFTQIAAGAYHGMALDHEGRLYTWGDNFYGQLGLGNNSSVMVPTFVSNVADLTRIYAGFASSYAISTSSLVLAWGMNSTQQLGMQDEVARNVPTCISDDCVGVVTPTTMLKVNALYVGYHHVLARDPVQDLYYWGLNSVGQLGNQPETFLPVQYPTKNTTTTRKTAEFMTGFAAGDAHTLGIDLDGYVFGWGSNTAGQLGNNNPTETFNKIPAKVFNPIGVEKLNLRVSIAAGTDQTPDNVTFEDVTDVGLRSEVRSSEITITGIDGPTPLSVAGGEYVVNPGNPINASDFSSSNGTVNVGDRIVVRHFSPATHATKTTTVLTVGGERISFESTTAQKSSDGSGGGCTLVQGQGDLSIFLLLLVVVWLQFRKHRGENKCGQCP